MNPYQVYRKQQQQPTQGTRIDLLLALYDGAIDRLNRAEKALHQGERNQALSLLARCQLIVSELAAAVRVDIDPDNGPNILRVYEYVVYLLGKVTPEAVADARKLLSTLREGFEAIRPQAVQMELRGAVVSSANLLTVCETA